MNYAQIQSDALKDMINAQIKNKNPKWIITQESDTEVGLSFDQKAMYYLPKDICFIKQEASIRPIAEATAQQLKRYAHQSIPLKFMGTVINEDRKENIYLNGDLKIGMDPVFLKYIDKDHRVEGSKPNQPLAVYEKDTLVMICMPMEVRNI